METVKQRILEFVESQGIKKMKFYEDVETSANSFTRTGMLRDIDGRTITKILEEYPQINAQWLMTGEGEMLVKNIKIDPVAASVIEQLKDQVIDLQSDLIDCLEENRAQNKNKSR